MSGPVTSELQKNLDEIAAKLMLFRTLGATFVTVADQADRDAQFRFKVKEFLLGSFAQPLNRWVADLKRRFPEAGLVQELALFEPSLPAGPITDDQVADTHRALVAAAGRALGPCRAALASLAGDDALTSTPNQAQAIAPAAREEVERRLRELLDPHSRFETIMGLLGVGIFVVGIPGMVLGVLYLKDHYSWKHAVAFFAAFFAIEIYVCHVVPRRVTRKLVAGLKALMPEGSPERAVGVRLLEAGTFNFVDEEVYAAVGAKRPKGKKTANKADPSGAGSDGGAGKPMADGGATGGGAPALVEPEIASTFACGPCRKQFQRGKPGALLTCNECRVAIRVPKRPACPACGSNDVQFGRELVQKIERDGQGPEKLAGAALFGPAGLVAGGLLRAAKNAVADLGPSARVVATYPDDKFTCSKCRRRWAYAIPAAAIVPGRAPQPEAPEAVAPAVGPISDSLPVLSAEQRAEYEGIYGRPLTDLEAAIAHGWRTGPGRFASSRLFFPPNIPPQKLANARSSFGSPNDHGLMVGLQDSTLWGSAKIGLLVSTTHVCWYSTGDNARKQSFAFLRIVPGNVVCKSSFWSTTVSVGQGCPISLMSGGEQLSDLHEAVALFIAQAARWSIAAWSHYGSR